MSDNEEAVWTVCNYCGGKAHWQKTTNWVIIGSRCYHPKCAEDQIQKRPPTGTKNYLDSDAQYNGDFYDHD